MIQKMVLDECAYITAEHKAECTHYVDYTEMSALE
jgi:hypothetical protein